MAGITGQGTTFNLPNFVGELFAVSREDTPFLSAIGGLTGGRAANATLFQWSTYDLRAPEATRQRVEGAPAPTAEERVRGNVYNVVEIHQESVEVSYSKLAAVGQYAATGGHTAQAGIDGTNAVLDEMDWQVEQALKQVARDVNLSFIVGTFANPATNATARKTRGLLEAITTNAIDGAGTADLADPNSDLLGDLMQDVWDSGGIRENQTRTLLTNSTQKRKLTQRYITGANYRETSRNIGGVNVTSIETDFGTLNIMLEPAMPQDQIVVVSLEECAPRFLPIPGKGFLLVEPLAKTGASDKSQIYGEIGLEYGVESHHGKYIGLATS